MNKKDLDPLSKSLTIGQMLERTTPVSTPKHNFKNFDEAKLWAKKNIVGTYKNVHSNEDISVSGRAIKKYLSASAVLKSADKDAHLSALTQLPALIETSILKETYQDKNHNLDIKEIQRFYGAIDYEHNVYPVKITVKAYPVGTSNAYSYEVMEIESPIITT
ncbi:MAG: hypothetical protein FWG79_04665 [Bacteroidales bacterium]|nr:hypothetical protein [Bacteroidales bacterium]